MKINKTNNRK